MESYTACVFHGSLRKLDQITMICLLSLEVYCWHCISNCIQYTKFPSFQGRVGGIDQEIIIIHQDHLSSWRCNYKCCFYLTNINPVLCNYLPSEERELPYFTLFQQVLYRRNPQRKIWTLFPSKNPPPPHAPIYKIDIINSIRNFSQLRPFPFEWPFNSL